MAAPLIYPKADATTQWFDDDPDLHRGPLCAPGTVPKIVPHTTEGGSWPGYDGGRSAPHITFKADLLNKRVDIRQHFDFNRYARALATSGGRLINNGGAIQYEIVGTSGWASELNPHAPYHVATYVPGFPDWFWDEIAEFHAWCHTTFGVALKAQEFYPWNSPGPRMEYQDWLTYSGVVGHQAAPEPNNHVDPGAIPVGYVLAKAGAILYGKDGPVAKTRADALALERELISRGFTIYCGPSFYLDGRCRRGRHGHDNDSYHWRGEAVDVGLDPASGAPISNYERAHLDRLATELRSRGWRILWNVGPGNHQDHLHADTSNYRTIINLTGVSGITLKAGTFPNTGGPSGFSKSYVRDVQRDLNRLIDLDVLSGSGVKRLDEDGSLGPATKGVVKAYQRLRGLVADGLPGRATRARLDKDLTALGNNSGFTHSYIKDVQADLNVLIRYGWIKGAVLAEDGSLGPAATAAVKAYQGFAGLTQDGLPGQQTRSRLATHVAQAKVNDGFTIDYVKAVQRDLNRLLQDGALKVKGTSALTVDGSLGMGSRTVVKAFQAQRGLTADGLPGPATRAALRTAIQDLDSDDPAPAPTPVRTLQVRVAPFRVAGPNAYATNVEADRFVPGGGRGVLLVARDSPDVDSAQTIQARRPKDISVLLVPKDGGLPGVIAARIKEIKPSWLLSVGDHEAVSDRALYEALITAGIKVPG